MTDGTRDATGGAGPDADSPADDPTIDEAATDEADGTLADLLAGNRRHVDSRPNDGGQDDRERDDRSPIVAASCADAGVDQAATWGIEDPGRLVASATIGAQVWDEVDGERVVDGDLLFPLVEAGGGTVLVVGHTGCRAVTTAYRVATRTDDVESVESHPPGVRRRLGSLVPVVEAALDAGVARAGRERDGAGDPVDVVVETADDDAARADDATGSDEAPDADTGPVTIEIGDDGTGTDTTGSVEPGTDGEAPGGDGSDATRGGDGDEDGTRATGVADASGAAADEATGAGTGDAADDGGEPATDDRGRASPADGDGDLAEADVVNRLVEYAVDRQVAFLRDSGELPAGTRVYGFVYDAGRVYGDVPGRAYLVNLDGETDVDLVADRVPSRYREAVRRLLD